MWQAFLLILGKAGFWKKVAEFLQRANYIVTCPKESFVLTLGIIFWHISQRMKIIYFTKLMLSKITIDISAGSYEHVTFYVRL